MTKQIQLELDENLINDVTNVLDYVGLDIKTAIKMFLTRVTKERGVTFLFNQPKQDNQSYSNTKNYDDVPYDMSIGNIGSRNLASGNDKMTKSRAIRLFLNNGNKIARAVTFASKNRSAYNYWANPNLEILDEEWSLILNDNKKSILYLFSIPAGAIRKSQLTPRSDIPNLVDLQIMYNDNTFTDNRSGYSFAKFLIADINY